MSKGTCTVPGCDRPIKCMRVCQAHYGRIRAYGDPRPDVPLRQFRPRFSSVEEGLTQTLDASREDDPAGCWNWTGPVAAGGYAILRCDAQSFYAYRLVYERENGPIPDGTQVDHACRNKACVNPRHLRLVTGKQNMENMPVESVLGARSGLRGVIWDGRSGKWLARVTHHGIRHHRGPFHTVEEAHRAVLDMRNTLYTHNDADRAAG